MLKMKHEENETYKFEPADDENEQAWNIRILDGMFNETVIQYGAISANEVEGHLSFNFHVVSSPDGYLSADNVELQEHAGDILQNIIKTSIEKDDGTLALREKEKE